MPNRAKVTAVGDFILEPKRRSKGLGQNPTSQYYYALELNLSKAMTGRTLIHRTKNIIKKKGSEKERKGRESPF